MIQKDHQRRKADVSSIKSTSIGRKNTRIMVTHKKCISIELVSSSAIVLSVKSAQGGSVSDTGPDP